MKKYTEYSLRNSSNKVFTTPWANKEGVFLSPNGKYIARIRKRIGKSYGFNTLSQHEKEIDAQEAYDNYYRKIQTNETLL